VKTKQKIIVYFVIGVLVVNGILMVNSKQVQAQKPFFTLVAFPIKPWSTIDYYNLISNQLAKVGINVDVVVYDMPMMSFPELVTWRRYDLTVVELNLDDFNPTLMNMFSENGSLNAFGYHTSMDFDEKLGTGKNQWYLEQLYSMLPPQAEERIQLYKEWEDYFMDEILFMQPLTNKKTYIEYWDNLNGYNFTEGILKSWGKMSWDGVHPGQINTSEILISDTQWEDLNPFYQMRWDNSYSASSFVSSLILDPLFWLESDYSIKPHLAKSFSMLDDTHVRINLREGIKWQTDPEGNFTDEYFDAEDVYFTLYCRSRYIAPFPPYRINWLKDMAIIDPYTIDLFIDANLITPENEPYAQFLEDLCKMILPEHYLNQTQYANGTPVNTHPSWLTYITNCFGTGLFELKSYYTGIETILNVNPECWWLNSTITSDPQLDWENRFGTFSSNINQLRINIHTHLLEAMNLFEAGLIDISPILGSKPTTSIERDFQEKMNLLFTFLGYNIRTSREIIGNREPCRNFPSMTKGLAVRKAISYAINRDEINIVNHGGEFYIVDNPFFEARKIWSNPNIIRYDHDLEMAKYYLDLAGYTNVSLVTGFNAFDLFFLSFSILVIIVIFKRKKRIKVKKH